jgi:cell division protein FtsB
MRHWLTPRCLLVALLLVAAPGAALAHLLVTWVPTRLALAGLNREIAQYARQFESRHEQSAVLFEQAQRLRDAQQAIDDRSRVAWLPRRDRDAVFDQLADAFGADGAALERLTLEDPALYAAASRTNLLACERVTVECTGDYAALTACLDRIAGLDLPLRIAHLTWGPSGSNLSLALRIDVPFVPDATLGAALANAAKIEEQHEP